MGRKTPPYPNYPDWTTARFFGFIRGGLRQMFSRYPPKYNAIKEAASVVEEGVYKTGQKKGKVKYVKVYECAICNNQFKQKDVEVDHIIPAGSLKTFEDLSGFAERLFCGAEGLQVVCKVCHKSKTKEQRV